MALYSVYANGGSDAVTHKTVRLIKPGFSWFAFLFPAFWLLMNRIWRWFLIILAAEVGLTSIIRHFNLPDWTLVPIGFTIMAYVGVSGRDWLGAALERRGFRLMANVSGEDEDEAYAAYVRRPKLRSSALAEAKPAKSPENTPVIGLFPDRESRF